MQQNKINILCTRELEDSLIKEANQVGIAIDVRSFIETEAIRNIETQQEIENTFLQSATVVFTSMNAVETVADELLNEKPGWKIYCIGNTTKTLAKKYFGDQAVVGTASNAAELAELIVEESEADAVTFFCGDKRRNELPDILRNNNIDVYELVVYQTVALHQKIEKHYNGILFFSPSAVESFFRTNKLSDDTLLFAIGNTTANEIKIYSTNKIIISDEPGKENLFRKMIEYYT